MAQVAQVLISSGSTVIALRVPYSICRKAKCNCFAVVLG